MLPTIAPSTLATASLALGAFVFALARFLEDWALNRRDRYFDEFRAEKHRGNHHAAHRALRAERNDWRLDVAHVVAVPAYAVSIGLVTYAVVTWAELVI